MNKTDKAISLLEEIIRLNDIGDDARNAMEFLLVEIKGFLNEDT